MKNSQQTKIHKRIDSDSEMKEGSKMTLKDKNYIILAIGFAVVILGFILMTGGGSDSPEVFDAEAMFSFRRITLAPILVVIGFAIEVFAIVKKF